MVELINITEKIGLLVSILVIIFNALQLLLLHKYKRGLVFNLISLYFVNIGIANLFVGVLLLVYTTFKEEQKHLIDAPRFVYFHGVIVRYALVMTALNLVVISILRYISVTNTEVYRKVTRRTFIKICLVTWFLVATIVMGPYYLFDINNESYGEYFVYFSSLFGLPTIAIMTVIYGRIVLILWALRKQYYLHSHYCNSEKCRNLSTAKQKQNKPFPRIEEEEDSHLNSFVTVIQPPDEDLGYRKRFSNIFETQFVQLIGVSILLFVVCWIPLVVFGIFKIKTKMVESETTKGLTLILTQFALLYSLLSPLCHLFYFKVSLKRTCLQSSHRYLRTDGIRIS
jgi:7 transmembrane receptor (rhodopsin family).